MKQPRVSFLLYGVLASSSGALGLIQSLVFAKVLGPERLGYYSIILTVASYVAFAQLGILSGLNRELPVALGAREDERAQRLTGQVTVALLIVAVVGLFIITIAVTILKGLHLIDSAVQQSVLLGGLVAMSNHFFQLAVLRLRSELKLTLFSGTILMQKVLTLVGGVIAIYYTGFVGLVFVLITTNIVLYWCASRYFLAPVAFTMVRWTDISGLMSIGIPIMAGGVLNEIQLRMPVLFLVGVVTPTELGLFQFGMLPITIGLVFNGIISQYLFPKLLHEFGHKKSIMSVFKQSLLISVLIVGFSIAVLFLLLPIIRPVVERVLPDYVESLGILTVFCVGGAFITGNLVGIVAIAGKRLLLDVAAIGLSVIISLVGCAIAVHIRLPVWWFALITVSGIVVNYFARMAIAYYISGCRYNIQAPPC